MAGISLVLDLEGKATFDVQKVRTCLRGLPGVRNWDESNPRHLFLCEFGFAGDSAIVHMLNDLRFIAIEGMGDASLQVALEIQRCYGSDIHAVDLECSFSILLSTVSSLADFRDKMGQGELGV